MAVLCLCSCRSTSGNDHDQIVRTSIDLANAYLDQGKPDMAIDAYDRALTQADDYRLYYNKALILAETGNYADAAELSRSSFERYPYIIAFKHAQALYHKLDGNLEAYYDVCLEILELNPYDRDTREELMEAYSEARLYEKAYDQALILWNQGYMTDNIHQYLEKVRPDIWGNIKL